MSNSNSKVSLVLTDEINGNILHIDSGTTHYLLLTVANNSSQPITINPLSGDISEGNSNLVIKFVNNTFAFDRPPQMTAPDKWKAGVNQIIISDYKYASEIYLLTTEAVTLQPKGSQGDSIEIKMAYSKAYPRDFASAVDTRIILGQKVTAGEEQLTCHKDLQLLLLEDEGKPIPLAAELVGPRTILNNGTATSSLKLRITNTSPEPVQFAKPLAGGKTPTKMRVRVQLSDDANAYWALCKPDEAKDMAISVPNSWSQTPTETATEKSWELQPDYNQVKQIDGNGVLELTLSNVKSSLAPGFTDVFVYFQNFPIFGTQTQVVQIEKSPLIYSGHYVRVGTQITLTQEGNVGIGTTSPEHKLVVVTGSGEYGIQHTNGTTKLSTYVDSDGGWIGTESAHPLYFYTKGGGKQITLTQKGKVGIGTTSPEAELEVNGTTKTQKLQIGKTSIGEEELQVLQKLANSELTCAIACSYNGYIIDNYALRCDQGDRDRAIQFRSDRTIDNATRMKLLLD